VSEIFPLEIRAQAISFFYAVATLAGGVVAPWLFATLIGNGESRHRLFVGYSVSAVLMVVAGIVEFIWGVDAERKSLEAVARPLSARAETATSYGMASGLTGGFDAHIRREPTANPHDGHAHA
jgi:MFS family permease